LEDSIETKRIVTSALGLRVTQQISEHYWLCQELLCRLFRFGEVNLTPNKKASFGGYGIELDTHLATVLGGREGQKISPSEMTKRLWAYVKRNNLGKKN
jgi:chromatin remodeling complex protein RSC6